MYIYPIEQRYGKWTHSQGIGKSQNLIKSRNVWPNNPGW